MRSTGMVKRNRILASAGMVALALALASIAGAATASAEGIPHWHILTRLAPTKFTEPGEEGVVIGVISNLGDAPVQTGSTSKVTITDVLPEGLEATGPATAKVGFGEKAEEDGAPIEPLLSCTGLVCTYEGTLRPFVGIELKIPVKAGEEPGGRNKITVTGGNAKEAEGSSLPLSAPFGKVQFGVESYELTPETESGEVESNAGSHPFQLTTTLAFNQTFTFNSREKSNVKLPSTPELLKNVDTTLPPGLIGNTNYGAECTDEQFDTVFTGNFNACPGDSAAGVAIVTFRAPGFSLGYKTEPIPVFDLTPAKGEPARLGFEFEGVPIVLDTAVQTGKGYAVEVSSKNTSQTAEVLSVILTIWGTPAAESHHLERGWECLGGGYKRLAAAGGNPALVPACEPSRETSPAPYLTLPTTCAKPLESSVKAESWKPGEPPDEVQLSNPIQLNGCNGLPFAPAFEVTSSEHEASTPAGLNIFVKIPQSSTLDPTSLEASVAEANAHSTTVVFPREVLSNAGFGEGLEEACSAALVGFQGAGGFGEEAEASFQEQLDNDNFSASAAGCPEVAKIGTVRIVSPYLKRAEPLTGSLYLAKQHTDPFKPELMTYLTAENEESGIRVKLAGEVKIDTEAGAEEGQLTSTFRGTPPVPFETLEISLPPGGRASDTTPAFCGPATTAASFRTYSEEPGKEAQSVPASSSFEVTSGPNGSPCPGSTLPFSPSVNTGSTNTQAGAFSPFTLTIGHPDGQQALERVKTELPPGLAALISDVSLCSEEEANAGSCKPESQVGTSQSISGLGGDPVTLEGQLYLTGPLKANGKHGASPFGLLDRTEVNVGPFHFEKPVIVLSTININEKTAAATVESEPIPKFVEGVPAQLKAVNITVQRPGNAPFQFNPTSCEEHKITGQLTGYEGGDSPISEPFFVSNCASLPFQPKLTATVKAQGSKFNGTSFKVTVESPGLGQANIHKVDLTLPAVLPSRDSTIEKACLAATFEANPASCDEGSVIGEGVVYTPVFKNPLRGPAYLVSHGAAEFPDVEFVLQGEGVKILLDGKTDIKKGITYSKFETSPDAPFTKFESIFPEGPHSALTTYVPEKENYSLCNSASKLVIPTTIVAQNGAVIERTTDVSLEGCSGVKSFHAAKPSKAQRLAKALKACKKDKKKSKRVACERAARKKYGAKAKRSPKRGQVGSLSSERHRYRQASVR
jgi:hypothetical protein